MTGLRKYYLAWSMPTARPLHLLPEWHSGLQPGAQSYLQPGAQSYLQPGAQSYLQPVKDVK